MAIPITTQTVYASDTEDDSAQVYPNGSELATVANGDLAYDYGAAANLPGITG